MFKVGSIHRILAYIAAAAAVASIILAGISKFTGQPVMFSRYGYIDIATVAIIFAIYFLLEGAVYSAKKDKD